jgi:hypothetical protein
MVNELVTFTEQRGVYRLRRMTVPIGYGERSGEGPYMAWIVDTPEGAAVFLTMAIDIPQKLFMTVIVDGVQVMGMDVGGHRAVRTSEWENFHEECPYREGQECFYDGSGLMAIELLEAYERSGFDEEIIWTALTAYHKAVIGGETND